jgi:hypothetical protein
VRYDQQMEIADVRRRLRSAIEDARRLAEERRGRKDEASRAWERVLAEVAAPACHSMASALTGEGMRFKVVTPGAAVRLTPERGGEEFVELALDTERDTPAVMLRSTRGRGRRVVSDERVLRDGAAAIASLTEEDVIVALLRELVPFIER